MRHLIAGALALLILAGPALAVAADKVKVTVPAAAVTFASLYHAKTAGYFEQEGLDVEIVTVPGGGSLQALIAKDAQVCLTPATYQMQAYEKGQPLLATATILNRNAINVVMHKDVARDKGIIEKSPLADKIKALKGLKVSGVAVGSFSYQVMLYYLLKAGIDPQKDVQCWPLNSGRSTLSRRERRSPMPPSPAASAS
jgi:NitT/TauT family transport system substrate-binding protein